MSISRDKGALENGSGYEEDVVAGIDWCIGQNVSIISLSLGVDKIDSYFGHLVEPSKIRSTMQLLSIFVVQQQEMMEMMMMAMLLLLK